MSSLNPLAQIGQVNVRDENATPASVIAEYTQEERDVSFKTFLKNFVWKTGVQVVKKTISENICL